MIGLVALLALAAVTIVFAANKDDLADVRAATAQFHRTEAAQAGGWDLVPGLDHCFDNLGVGGKGFHYINTAILDTELDPQNPEAMIYAPGPNGRLQPAAVEFIIPADAWDAENNELPMLFGRSFHLNEVLNVYVLHAWIWKNNPAGMFEDWNPDVSCP